MKKKVLAMLMVAAMACAVFAGCGGKGSDSSSGGGQQFSWRQ